MYIRKSKGPSSEPCKTPYVSIDVLEELKTLMDTYCFLLYR